MPRVGRAAVIVVAALAACNAKKAAPPEPRPPPTAPAPAPGDTSTATATITASPPSVVTASPDDRAFQALCARDDGTGRPLPKSTGVDSLGARVASKELASLNETCGDIWCEGSFEFYFHDLRCDATKANCQLGMRLYTHLAITPAADMTKLDASGPGFHARVLGQAEAGRCSVPCTKAGSEVTPPCGIFDVRCELDARGGRPELDRPRWFERVSACIGALEGGIRERVPEFLPRDR